MTFAVLFCKKHNIGRSPDEECPGCQEERRAKSPIADAIIAARGLVALIKYSPSPEQLGPEEKKLIEGFVSAIETYEKAKGLKP